MADFRNSIFEFRMKGSKDGLGHCWERGIDIREISVEELGGKFEYVLLKMDGINNKTKVQEQVQLHFGKRNFEELIEGINRIIPRYKELVDGKSQS